jgi:hypothetical protein
VFEPIAPLGGEAGFSPLWIGSHARVFNENHKLADDEKRK